MQGQKPPGFNQYLTTHKNYFSNEACQPITNDTNQGIVVRVHGRFRATTPRAGPPKLTCALCPRLSLVIVSRTWRRSSTQSR